MNNDLISRSALKEDMKSRLSACNEWIEKAKDKETKIRASAVKAFIAEVVMTIDNFPTAFVYTKDDMTREYLKGYNACKDMNERPQGEWIPVSERLPESRDWYLGLFKEPDTDFIGIPYICDYVGKVTKGTTKEGWILRHCTDVDTVPDYFRNLICVAWQPLPEPYMEGGAE